jgi:hypothetical protein
MARPGPATQAKRKRERAKQDKRKAKEERRALRKQQKALKSTPALAAREETDLDGIVAGPQKPSID